MVDEEEPIKEFLENQRNCKNILPLSLLFFGGGLKVNLYSRLEDIAIQQSR